MKKTKFIMVRVTEKEHRDVARAAKHRGLTVTGWVRFLFEREIARIKAEKAEGR